MTNQTGDNYRCPRCNAVVLKGTVHQCYDPFGESYFNPSFASPMFAEMISAIKTMNENLAQLNQRLKRLEDTISRTK